MKILVVDDNIEILEGMKQGIRWKEIGIENVYFADKVSEAKRIILQQIPDILLTDIEMPEESGLDLWCWAHEISKEMKCVFISSHAEFKYAQEAIRKGGSDYILQPAKSKIIEEAILNCKNQVLVERELKKLAEKGMVYEKISEKALDHLAEAAFQKENELDSMEERIRFVERYIENHLDEDLLRADMAKIIYLNEDYFSKKFKYYTGKGYKEYVLGKKMEYACKLLEETRFPVSVVSVRVGYDNFSNFTQAFKKYIGLTPQEYRRQKKES